jgi:hypothetical protein
MINSEFIKQLIGGPSDFGIGWMIILISSIITILVALVGFFGWLNEKIQYKRHYLKKISLLALGTPIDYFKTLLGDPVFINKVSDYDEYIFVNYYFYVQALVDSNRKVVLFSITTKEKRFNPVLNISDINVVLGKTKFSEVGELEKIITHPGNHGGLSTYSELHYFGNPGHYLKYVFSINENGCGKDIFDVPLYFYLTEEPEDQTALKKFRVKATINTYTISGFFWDEDWEKEINEGLEFGPKNLQIRILNR